MAFVSERNIAIGNALERAYFEVINAKEAKAQARDDQTMLWHIYKAQKGLKEAAALLVERQPLEHLASSLRGEAEATDHVGQSGIVDCHEAKASHNDRLQFYKEILNRHCERGEAIDHVGQAVDSCEQQHNSTAKLLEGLSSEQKAMVLTDVIIRTLRGDTDNEH